MKRNNKTIVFKNSSANRVQRHAADGGSNSKNFETQEKSYRHTPPVSFADIPLKEGDFLHKPKASLLEGGGTASAVTEGVIQKSTKRNNIVIVLNNSSANRVQRHAADRGSNSKNFETQEKSYRHTPPVSFADIPLKEGDFLHKPKASLLEGGGTASAVTKGVIQKSTKRNNIVIVLKKLECELGAAARC